MNHRLQIDGTKGSIMVARENIVKWSLWDESDEKEVDLLETDDEIAKLASAKHEWDEGHYVQYQDMVHAAPDDIKPLVSGEDGLLFILMDIF